MTKVAAATSKSAQELLRYQQNNGYLNDVRLESFGFFLDNYVIYGGDLTFDKVDAYKLLLSEGIISLNDQLWRAFIKEFRINKYNTTYYVGFLHEKGYVIGETEPAENYMRLWTIPVDANGVIGVPIDHRNMYGYLKFKAKYDGVYLNVDEVQQAITNANSAADKANEAASDVQGAVDEAKRAVNQANEAVVKTETVLKNVSSSLSLLDKSIEDANKAIGESNTATASAKQAAQDAISAKDNLSNAVNEKINQTDTAIKNANDAAGVANQASESIKGWGNKRQWNKEQYYEKNNIVTYNGSTWQALRPNKGVVPVEGEDWTCLAQKGVDGTGAVSSVNGNFPDENGNVELDIQQGTVQKVNGKIPDGTGEVTLVASDLGEMSGDQLTNESVSLAKLAQDVQDAIKKSGGNSYFIPYPLSATIENQKTWDLPANSYDAATDSLLVFHNRGILDNESWTITGDAGTGYTLVIPENPILKIEDNNVLIIVLKNTPSEVPASISGALLTPNSVGLEKLGQDVKDALNNGSSIEIVNNLIDGGIDKVLSAEMGKVLKNEVDGNSETVKNLEQTVSQNQQVITEKVENLQQTVSNNQEVVTEHLGQSVTSEDGAHDIRYINDKLEIKNGSDWSEIEIGKANARGTQSISPNHAIRRFPVFSGWANDTTAESLWLVMDDLDLRGQFIVRGAIGNTPASADLGGFEYSLQVQRNAGTNTQEPNEPEILYYSTYMSARFNILGQATIQQTFQPVIPITKRRFAAPLYIEIEYMTVNGNAFDVLDSIEFQLQPPQVAPNTDPQQVSLFKDVAGKANKVQENFIRAVLDMGTQDSTYPISYYKDSLDRVHVEGQAQANGSGMIAFTMPVGYRPKVATQVVVPQTTSPVGMKTMSVQVNGYLIISGLTASSFASFNFSYRVGA
ncbi:hypothetical protein [Lysinibacillus sp. BNK-21]|uniref:hypothetical protein n=1 Tax=Lysinibacillus sp. BNK-21 TaxID=3376156 RepID=UPI003B42B9E8